MVLENSLTPFPYSAPYCAEGNDVHGRCAIQHQPVYLNSQLAHGWVTTRNPGTPMTAGAPLPRNAPHDRQFERIPSYCTSRDSLLCQLGL